MNQAYLKNILSAQFDFDIWKDLLEKIFPKVEIFTSVAKITDSHVKDGGHVGNIRLDDGRSLAIFRFEVADNVQISRNRKSLRDIAAKYVDQGLIHGALVFYYSQNLNDYRLTFIAKQTYFNESGELVKKETAPKRYTFLLGKNEPCTTAASRLKELADKRTYGSIYLTDVTDAFSVERLNKEFFNGYKAQYAKFLKLLEDKKQHRDYVKKMLGRLVFLQFLQKKGWMGVSATNENWEGGDKNYLANLIERYKGNDRILSDVLEPLFFETLNKERVGDIADCRLGDNIKIPYLNGGLFDKDKTDALDIDFPYSYFEDLMEFFNGYNFTIDENDPDDAEVGVDPEMLGHIFENLLEDNKDKGAFYTPKEIVQYMCRQSVIQYLKAHEADEKYSLAIERLINESVVEPVLQNKETATRFIELLKNVKVCDPAIGSGAFPMGILYVLYYALHHLQSHAEPNKSFDSTKTKRNIIQNNIFGVDIEQGAVDIARLRFWLALVVDADEPQPLPNLDYKITCGNSLLNRYALDTPLDNVFIEYNKDKNDDDKLSLAKYKQLVNDYTNTSNHAKKDLFRKTIEEIKKTFKTELSKKEINKIVSVKKDIYDLEQPNLFGEELTKTQKSELKKLKAKLEKLESEREDVLNNKVYEDAFEWRFEFPQLLDENGKFIGFDIIIGNPPYIKEATDKNAFDGLRNTEYYQGKMDLWYIFACKGIDLLKSNACLCYIATNNWVTNDGASILRNKIVSDVKIIQLIDFFDAMVFDSASIQTMIMLFQKDSVADNYFFDYRKVQQKHANKQVAINLLEKIHDDSNVYFMPLFNREHFSNQLLTFASTENDQILQLISNAKHILLNDQDGLKEISSGIDVLQDYVNKKSQQLLNNKKQIGDGIFVLSQQEYDSLNLNGNEKALVKPYYTSKQINRYSVCKKNSEWIIYTDSSTNDSISLYPNIQKHLDQFFKVITSVNKPYGLHRARKKESFEGEKILALRKCVNSPAFSYVNFDSFVSRAYLIIKTNRVNQKYLTGLLNSTLIKYWLKHRGKMQGANFQIDKEPLQQIPIVTPAINVQELIATIVDYVMIASSTKENLSELVSNETIASFFEKIIDGCVYELYFEEHMKEQEINIIDSSLELIKPITQLSSDKEKADMILDVFMNIKKTDNSIRNRLDLFTLRSPEILKLIIEG
ncbi:MAG: DNA modification methylase [Lentimicrobiaceae bacterium]|nr:DNA modification methylase [Lentimicrobiaceae bacterium]